MVCAMLQALTTYGSRSLVCLKLKALMEDIISEPVPLPAQLARFLGGQLHVVKMPNGFTAFKRLLLDNA